jgi:hypothetical protein
VFRPGGPSRIVPEAVSIAGFAFLLALTLASSAVAADPGSTPPSDTPQIDAYVALALAPLVAFAGVLAGQLLPEYFSRRRVVRDRYDAAISAVAGLQAARHGAGLDVPVRYLKPIDSKAGKEVIQELSTEGVRSFLVAAAAARAALAALHPYSPDLRPYWNKFEVAESELDPLVGLLYERRKRPLKRHAPV